MANPRAKRITWEDLTQSACDDRTGERPVPGRFFVSAESLAPHRGLTLGAGLEDVNVVIG